MQGIEICGGLGVDVAACGMEELRLTDVAEKALVRMVGHPTKQLEVVRTFGTYFSPLNGRESPRPVEYFMHQARATGAQVSCSTLRRSPVLLPPWQIFCTVCTYTTTGLGSKVLNMSAVKETRLKKHAQSSGAAAGTSDGDVLENLHGAGAGADALACKATHTPLVEAMTTYSSLSLSTANMAPDAAAHMAVDTARTARYHNGGLGSAGEQGATVGPRTKKCSEAWIF